MNPNKELKKRGRPPKVVEPLVESESLTAIRVMILSKCNNPTWVRGRINGFGVNVKVPAQIGSRLIGKEINVELIASELGDYYQYLP